MKSEERMKARSLRQEGCSVAEIAKRTGCSKSSISHWVKGIPLTAEQINRLESNQARGRATAANHPNGPRQAWGRIRSEIEETAVIEVPLEYSRQVLLLIGSVLYWAEGTKKSHGTVNFTNSDPAMVALMMRFFREVCGVPEAKFRGVVHIHPHLDAAHAKQFWSKISEIPLTQFNKTQIAVSKASQGKRDTLPLGTFRVVISNVRLKSRITGWIKGVAQWGTGAISSVG